MSDHAVSRESLSSETPSAPDVSLRLAGALLLLSAVGFIVVFLLLGSAFGYPDVLDLSPADVLPRLVAGGPGLLALWAAFAFLPVLLAVTALVSHGRLGLGAL